MALTEQLPVYRDVYRLITIVFQVTQNYPRDYKYSLGQDMKRDSLKLVRSIYRANRSVSKREWLEDFSGLTDEQRAFLWGTVYTSEW